MKHEDKKEEDYRREGSQRLKILADLLHLSHLLQCHHCRPTLSLGSKASKEYAVTEANWTDGSTLI